NARSSSARSSSCRDKMPDMPETGVTPRNSVEPFTISVPDHQIADLRSRLRATRWPDHFADAGSSYGTDLGVLRPLATYWADEYDWRTHERELNSFPQFVTEIQGQRIHFLHVRSSHADALPLVLTHGWPGSISEFTRLVEPLTDPTAHGGSAGD